MDNVINNPHTTSLHLHQQFTIFREEVIQKRLGVKYYWYIYEWKHRGTTHVHGFLWLENAPDMDKIEWENKTKVEQARKFFDRYVSAWNPRPASHRNNPVYHPQHDDPCLLNTTQILAIDPSHDYEEIINCFQRHRKWREGTCLHKNGKQL